LPDPDVPVTALNDPQVAAVQAMYLSALERIGDAVEKGEPLATIHYNSDAKLAEARDLISASYHIGEHPPSEKRPLVRHILGA
jgi:thymidine phosphorylase